MYSTASRIIGDYINEFFADSKMHDKRRCIQVYAGILCVVFLSTVERGEAVNGDIITGPYCPSGQFSVNGGKSCRSDEYDHIEGFDVCVIQAITNPATSLPFSSRMEAQDYCSSHEHEVNIPGYMYYKNGPTTGKARKPSKTNYFLFPRIETENDALQRYLDSQENYGWPDAIDQDETYRQMYCSNSWTGVMCGSASYCEQCDTSACPQGQVREECRPPRTTNAKCIVVCEMGNMANGAICVPCAEGTYSDTVGQTSCKQCPEGTYSDTAGQTSCEQCAEGTYSDTAGQTSCEQCPKGKYTVGQTSCELCPRGKYSDTVGRHGVNSVLSRTVH